jgi:hypothetical protein
VSMAEWWAPVWGYVYAHEMVYAISLGYRIWYMYTFVYAYDLRMWD